MSLNAGPGLESSPKAIDLEGKERSLAEFFGEHTLIFLWASWCPECIVEMGTLNIVQRNLASENIKVVAIAVNDDLNSVLQAPPVRHAEFPVLIDIKDQVRDRYPLSGLPTVYLLDARGASMPLIDMEDRKRKMAVVGFREWQSRAGTRAVMDSLSME